MSGRGALLTKLPGAPGSRKSHMARGTAAKLIASGADAAKARATCPLCPNCRMRITVFLLLGREWVIQLVEPRQNDVLGGELGSGEGGPGNSQGVIVPKDACVRLRCVR